MITFCITFAEILHRTMSSGRNILSPFFKGNWTCQTIKWLFSPLEIPLPSATVLLFASSVSVSPEKRRKINSYLNAPFTTPLNWCFLTSVLCNENFWISYFSLYRKCYFIKWETSVKRNITDSKIFINKKVQTWIDFVQFQKVLQGRKAELEHKI